jgi:hypothetical protein
MPLGTVPIERTIRKRKSNQYRLDIDPLKYAAYIDALTNGASKEAAAWNVGLNPNLIRKWMERGELLEEVDDFPENSQAWQYVRFFRDVKKAIAQFELLHVANINTASVKSTPHNWTASAWMLERRRPEEFSQKYIIEKITDQKVLETIKFIFDNVDDHAREQVASAINLLPSLKMSEAS